MIRRRAVRSSAFALVAFLSACTPPAAAPPPPRSSGGHPATFPCPAKATAAGDADEAKFTRDQPVGRGLLTLGRKIVTRTSPPFEVDADALAARPIPLPGDADVIELSSDGRSLWALGKDATKRLRLFQRAGSAWREQALPSGSTDDEAADRALGVEGDVVALLLGSRLSILEHGRWSSRAVAPRRPAREGLRALLHRRRLYLGRDDGEWGGELVSIDIDAGAGRDEELVRRDVHDLPLPVRDLAVGPDGALWAVRGLAHMVMIEGQVFRHDAAGWKLIAAASGANLGPDSPTPGQCAGDWNLPFTNFDSIAFDAAGRVLLLTGTLGVVRREQSGGWTQLTPRWPEFVYADGLAVSGTKLVLGTYDAGPLVSEPESGRLQRVPLRPPPSSTVSDRDQR